MTGVQPDSFWGCPPRRVAAPGLVGDWDPGNPLIGASGPRSGLAEPLSLGFVAAGGGSRWDIRGRGR